MKDIQALIRALDEWAAADDRANEAAAALSQPAPLGKGTLADVRALQRVAVEKLEAVRKLLADDSDSTGLVEAVAQELIDLGYRPATTASYIRRASDEPMKLVAPETWATMGELLRDRLP